MKKHYYIIPENKVESFTVQCASKISDGEVCYLANSCTTGEEVWLYKDTVEYTKPKRKIVSAYEVKTPIQGLTPNEYFWGGEIRDKRTRSMCARPYFSR